MECAADTENQEICDALERAADDAEGHGKSAVSGLCRLVGEVHNDYCTCCMYMYMLYLVSVYIYRGHTLLSYKEDFHLGVSMWGFSACHMHDFKKDTGIL